MSLALTLYGTAIMEPLTISIDSNVDMAAVTGIPGLQWVWLPPRYTPNEQRVCGNVSRLLSLID